MLLILFTHTVCGVGKSTLSASIALLLGEDRAVIVAKDEIFRDVVAENPDLTKHQICSMVNKKTEEMIGEASEKLVGVGHGRDGVIILDRNMVGVSRADINRFCSGSVRPLRIVTVGFDWGPSRDGYFTSSQRRLVEGGRLQDASAAELLLVMSSACMRGGVGERSSEDTRRAFVKFWLAGSVEYSIPIDVTVPVWGDCYEECIKTLSESIREFRNSSSYCGGVAGWDLSASYMRSKDESSDPFDVEYHAALALKARCDPREGASRVSSFLKSVYYYSSG